MLDYLDKQTRLTGNQYKIITAAVVGDMLEFFDLYLIAYVLAFIAKPWQLTYGESMAVLLSSGVGAIIGAYVWGYVADRIGRKTVFIATVINFSLATGILALTPDRGWIFLTVFRFFVGVGVGGLYVVDLPLVQEFMGTSKRGFIGGIVTSCVPLGNMLGAILGAYLAPVVGWRGLFVVGLLPALLTLLIRAWVPESPRWLARMGRHDEARQSLAWALEIDLKSIPLSAVAPPPAEQTRFLDLFRYPRSLVVSWFGNLGIQTGIYGISLWAPVLLVMLMKVSPADASFWMIFVTGGSFVGRFFFAWLSEVIGRRASSGIVGLGAAASVVLAGLFPTAMIGTISVFWLLPHSGQFRRQRRLLRDRALRGGSLAGEPARHWHGLCLWFRRHRQVDRAGRARLDHRLVQHHQPASHPRCDHAGLPLPRRLVHVRRRGLSRFRLRDQGPFVRGDRRGTAGAAATAGSAGQGNGELAKRPRASIAANVWQPSPHSRHKAMAGSCTFAATVVGLCPLRFTRIPHLRGLANIPSRVWTLRGSSGCADPRRA
jgi:MFS transporter, putative metabolite:H+ symporter